MMPINDTFPLVTIALPAYKQDFFEESIRSVLAQSYQHFELVIIDDASPFHLENIINKFDDPRVKYYRNEVNLGRTDLVSNWNKCISMAKGDLFCLFSDDDKYHSDFLQEMVDLSMVFPASDIFHCRVIKINGDGEPIDITPLCPQKESTLEFIWHTMKGNRNLYAPEFMCRTNALRNIGGFFNLPLAWGSDYVTWFLLSRCGGKVYCEKPLCFWRMSEINISAIGNVQQRIIAINLYQKWLTIFLDQYVAISPTESLIKKQCKSNIEPFFNSKRTLLLQIQIEKDGVICAFFKFLKYAKIFQMRYPKVVYHILRRIIDA
jgi:glycosyltransferase involved in cell wall biosynthesis